MSTGQRRLFAASIAALVTILALGFGVSSTSEDTPEPFTPQTVAPAVEFTP